MNKEKILIFSLSAILFLAVSLIVYSWSEPTTTMPGDYTEPINTSDTGQTKEGWLKVNGPLTTPMIYDADGCVGDNCPYYINPSGNSVISGKIVMENEIQDSDEPGTVITKGYVGKMINANNGSQILYLVGKNIACPDGYVSLERFWSSKTCASGTSCTTPEEWAKDPLTCTYTFRDRCDLCNCCSPGVPQACACGGSSGCCQYATCTADEWSEIMCIGMTKGDEEYLATAKHKVSECTGEVVVTSDGYKICRYNSATCPSGWYQFYNWSTTATATSTPYDWDNPFYSCTTQYHNWSNQIPEVCTNCSLYHCYTATATITQIGCI